ncbi:MAG: HAD family hydrolase, partial [Saprospiraceae bacterium]
IPLDRDRYKSAYGFPIPDYYKKIGIDLEKESFEALIQKFTTYYEDKVLECSLFEAAIPILQRFQTKGFNQYILTAARTTDVLHLLNHFAIPHFFQVVVGVDNYKSAGKLKKGIQLMEANQLPKAQTVLIGDTISDYKVATSMGIDCILIAAGHQSKKRLVDYVPTNTVVIDVLNQLPQILISTK